MAALAAPDTVGILQYNPIQSAILRDLIGQFPATELDYIVVCLQCESTDLRDELDRYLSSDPEHVVDAVHWWYDRCAEYPCLSRMAINYLVIPYK
jgi:hypothetical protein